jgi:hypothetical protein
MKSIVIHGVYESLTLHTLKSIGVKEFSFDLRTRSLNFLPLRDLLQIISEFSQDDRVFLTFENDHPETITSTLNILRNKSHSFNIIFRDDRPASYYRELHRPFYWMFHPGYDWKNILKLENVQGILLPLCHKAVYQSNVELWDLIDKKSLEVYLHADNFEQGLFISLSKNVKLSIDLTSEVEGHYRSVDQVKLRKMKIWSKLYEDFAGQ